MSYKAYPQSSTGTLAKMKAGVASEFCDFGFGDGIGCYFPSNRPNGKCGLEAADSSLELTRSVL
jgi:hypothetical protein